MAQGYSNWKTETLEFTFGSFNTEIIDLSTTLNWFLVNVKAQYVWTQLPHFIITQSVIHGLAALTSPKSRGSSEFEMFSFILSLSVASIFW